MWLILLHAPPAPFVPEEWHGKQICRDGRLLQRRPRPDVDEVLAPIRALGDPIVDLLRSSRTPSSSRSSTRASPRGMHYYWKTEYLAELSDGLLSTLRDAVRRVPDPGGASSASSISAGRSTSTTRTTGPSATGTPASSSACTACGSPTSRTPSTFRQWVRDAWERVRPFSTGGTYINFQTADEGDDRIRRRLREELRAPRAGQGGVRPGQPVPREPEHPAGGLTAESSADMTDTRILIVGAGIAGLAAARTLARAGFSAEVVEREPAWGEAGTGIYLPGNAARALRALGLEQAVSSEES